MTPSNLVVIMSDEHCAAFVGSRGHPLVRTPNLDALAARGTQFVTAYCNSPICVPSRASLATGRYAHDCGFWDNATPYDGSVPSWSHRLREQGHSVVSVGKLHFRDARDDNGFTEEIAPLHVVGGVGDLLGLIRDDLPVRAGAKKLANTVGRGETDYTAYDRKITEEAVHWLSHAPRNPEKPWVLFVSFVCPHFPLVAPPEFYDLYAGVEIEQPPLYSESHRPDHPYYAAMRECINYDSHFDDEKREQAIRGYLGLVSFMDDNVGKVLAALKRAGHGETTRVIYTSDHGEALGKRGLWGKSTMFEESVAVPLIMAGPDIKEGVRTSTAVSLVDIHPTILRSVGADDNRDDADLPGQSLYDLVHGGDVGRVVFSEYHAAGASTGCFMLRSGKYKLVHFVGLEPELFDMDADPDEIRNLAKEPKHSSVLADMTSALRRIVDPVWADQKARAHQRAVIARHGGKDAILSRGDFGHSPPPGSKPEFGT